MYVIYGSIQNITAPSKKKTFSNIILVSSNDVIVHRLFNNDHTRIINNNNY